MRTALAAASLIALLLINVGTAWAAEGTKQSAVNKVSDKLGFQRCSSALNSVVNFVHDDNDYTYLNTWGVASPNDSLFNSLTVRRYGDSYSVSSISVTPSTAGKCDSSLTQVLVFGDTSCPTLREKTFKNWKFYSEMAGIGVYEDPTSNSSVVMLIPNGVGCLVVKNLVAYFKNDASTP